MKSSASSAFRRRWCVLFFAYQNRSTGIACNNKNNENFIKMMKRNMLRLRMRMQWKNGIDEKIAGQMNERAKEEQISSYSFQPMKTIGIIVWRTYKMRQTNDAVVHSFVHFHRVPRRTHKQRNAMNYTINENWIECPGDWEAKECHGKYSIILFSNSMDNLPFYSAKRQQSLQQLFCVDNIFITFIHSVLFAIAARVCIISVRILIRMRFHRSTKLTPCECESKISNQTY